MKDKCFLSLFSWFLIVSVVLLQAPTGNGSNGGLKNGEITLRVRVPMRDGFPQFVKVVWDPSQQKYNVFGYCMDVFNAVLTYLPFNVSIHIVPIDVESSKISGRHPILKQISHKMMKEKNEVVVGDVTILAYRSELVDFTVPYTVSGVKMVVPVKHGRDQNMWTFVLKSCSRFVLMVWLLLALLLMQSYTANLTSILTLDQLQPSFLNFDPSKLRPYRNIGEYHDALKLGSKNGGVAAIFDEVPYLKLYLQEYGSNYIMSGSEYRNAGFGFVFPLNSNLTAYFSRGILNVMESGLMNEIDEKYFGKSDIGEDSSAETSSSPLSLSFHSFSGLFFISGIAILLALLVSERFIWQRLILMAKALSERRLLVRQWQQLAEVWRQDDAVLDSNFEG
ncbi:glutamate receptor [Vigna unguiculata]|uniref:Glutamate receptor n=1 Tax=Vigna unguiculata TaxID=3917 RepID=A0A4D6KSD1_VIGUN|nr:glutamate receptor [Vigna unguiculata]